MCKSIGIVGGMGPLATADLFKKIVLSTKAGSDNEHIRVFMDNNPSIPDRTAAILNNGPDPFNEMAKAVKSMEACGADCLVMPCNTAHYFLPRLQEITDIPFVSMLKATAKAGATAFAGKTAALLGTKGTLSSGVYDGPLKAEGVNYILPDESDRDLLMQGIYDVKSGRDISHMKDDFDRLLDRLRQNGADYFILGCTELPLIAELLNLDGPFIDPTLELAKAAILFCGYEIK